MTKQTSESLRGKLKRFEGFREEPYIPVPGDRLTIGYGFTKGVKLGDKITREEADIRFNTVIIPYEKAVWDACTLEPNDNEFDAMVSLCYNIGPGWEGEKKPEGAKDGFRQSSVLRAHNKGDKASASRAFSLWNKSSGVEYPGLVTRRAWEAALYLKPVVEMPMPQAVDGESKLAESPINKASVIAGGTAAAAAIVEVSKAVADVKNSIASLGDWLLPAALVIVVGLTAYIVWQRHKQRRGGWA